MNEQETTKEEGLDLSPKKSTESLPKKPTTTSEKELLTESNTDCKPCRYFDICMERRGRCKDFADYEAIKQKVREEIENINRGRAENA